MRERGWPIAGWAVVRSKPAAGSQVGRIVRPGWPRTLATMSHMTSASGLLHRLRSGVPDAADDQQESLPVHGIGCAAGSADRDRPRWVLPALIALLVGTAILYLVVLGETGNANSYYAAAVQAGSESWKAWFFGALDAGSSITVDKPPASLWVMGLSARIFGFSSWSMLVPQVLEGVATVALLFATVRRVAGPIPGLIAGTLLALTPAAALIFRFNNPDALLLLLVVSATYAITRALQSGATRWLVLAGIALGFGFLTKSAQALLVLPALSIGYLAFGPRRVGRRILQLLAAAGALVASAGWWIVAVLLWPADSRPYIGGSTDNNPLELAFGYNGLGRLFGESGGAGGGAGGGTGGMGQNSGFGGSTGLTRLFRGEFALEISWLIPAALIAIGALVWLTWRRPRTDALRSATVIWGGSLLTTGLIFSFMQGTIHPYYSVALAPSIAALVALAGCQLWRRRGAAANILIITMVAVTAGYGVTLLVRNDTTGYAIIAGVAGVLAIVGLGLRAVGGQRIGRLLPVVALLAVLAVALPVGDWGVRTATTAHTGSIPTAVAGSSGFGQMGSPGGRPGGAGGQSQDGPPSMPGSESGQSGTGTAEGGAMPGGSFPGAPGGSSDGGSSGTDNGTTGSPTEGTQGRDGTSSGSQPGGMSGMGGMGGASNSALNKALKATTTTWSAATVGAQSAAELELDTDTSVIAIGGFTGSDNAPTLAQFKQWVKEGRISYFVAGQSGGGPGGGGSSSAASAISQWVQSNFKTKTIGGTTVYVLTS